MERPPSPLPLLITTAITVSAEQTVLIDAAKRLELTLAAIRRWRLTPGVKDVIVCDGSGFDLKPLIPAEMLENGVARCEVLTFTNDLAAVRDKGKGYGEGEIVNYALKHSQVLGVAPVFAKCTGKLWVENYADCRRRFNGFAAFDVAGFFKPRQIDTRFYMVNREFFMTHMSTLHKNVNDAEGIYLEHAFIDGFKALNLSDYVMFPTPRIRGVSGTSGDIYQSRRLRDTLRDLRSLMMRLRH